MPEMGWHDSVLVELRRTRQAVEKLAELLEQVRPPNKKEVTDQIASAEKAIAREAETQAVRLQRLQQDAQERAAPPNPTSYADWRRAAAYTDTPIGIEQERANIQAGEERLNSGPEVRK